MKSKKPPKSKHLEIAQRSLAQGRLGDAENAFKAAIAAAPKDARTRLAFARYYNRQRQSPNAALEHVKELLKLAPRSAEAHQEAAETYCSLQLNTEAVFHAEQAIKRGGNKPDVLYVAATVYHRIDEFETAISLLNKSLSLRPDHLQSRLLLASALRSAGDMPAARELLIALFKEYPDNLNLIGLYSQTGKIEAGDSIIQHLENDLLARTENKSQRATALKILAKAKTDTGDHIAAFELFQKAKQVDPQPFSAPAYANYVTSLTQGLSRADYFGSSGSSSEIPVLIVGMPRSGSTLLEQILASHPQVGAIGESPLLRNIAQDLRLPEQNGPAMVNTIKTMPAKDATRHAETYLNAAAKNHTDKIRIIDKRLHNYELLGLFARLMPRARIIHASRDPLDNCVSCYMQNLSRWHSYTWQLDDLGKYYTQYHRLMKHWHSALPNPILDVSYEDTVADTEGTARKVIEFLGLEWDDACLDFQNADNRARTLSVWQVRQPIYKTSVKRWKRYEQFLDPLKAELASFYPDGFE